MDVTFIPNKYAPLGVVIGHPETVAAVKAEVERLQKESAYYKNAARQRGPLPAIPAFVPCRVRVNCTVCGDTPFNSTYIEPGEYDCLSNRHGAVSVIASNGKCLGLRLDEFDVLLWRENEAAEEVRG